jgi:hypothetical protein
MRDEPAIGLASLDIFQTFGAEPKYQEVHSIVNEYVGTVVMPCIPKGTISVILERLIES